MAMFRSMISDLLRLYISKSFIDYGTSSVSRRNAMSLTLP